LNILFSHGHEPDKCYFFSSVSEFLKEKNHSIIHMSFSSQEKFIYNSLDKESNEIIDMTKQLKKYSAILSKNDINKYDIDNLLEFTYKINEINKLDFSKKKLKDNAVRYINFLNDYTKNNEIDKIIAWNETYMFDSILKDFSEKNNFEFILFEAGLFRPNTITIDSKGINYNNSINRNKQFYININIDNPNFLNELTSIKEKELYKYQKKKEFKKKHFIKEKIKDFLDSRLLNKRLDLSLLANNEMILQKVFRRIDNFFILFKNKFINKYKHKDNFEMKIENYIFVPFQVNDDSQIISHSPNIKNMFELVELVIKAGKKINKTINDCTYKLVFKEHPKDTKTNYSHLYRNYNDHENVLFLQSGDTKELINNSSMVITINSTVGLEALMNFKKVITLGDAFYNIEGIVNHVENPKNLAKEIINVKNKTLDKELVKKFIYFLRYEYQMEGNWKEGSFNKKHLMNFINEDI